MKRGWTGGVVTATIVAAACLDLSTDPDEIVAIEFAEFPWPSVVAGDTLRDATGAIVPLRARLFSGDGDEVTDAGAVDFLVQQGGVRVVGGNLLVADDTATGKASLFASTIGVQSVVRQIEIVAAPDSMAADGAIVPIQWVVPDNAQINVSQPIGARVFSATGAGVRAWVVRFQLEAAGRVIPESDTTQVFLINDSGRPSYADTTDLQGRVTRRVRLRVAPGLVPPDSAVITMSATYRGTLLTGSPLRLVLPLRPG